MYLKIISVFSLLSLTFNVAHSQNVYKINLRNKNKKVSQGQLNLGGVNPAGDTLSVNNTYIALNGKPFFPVIGEFHYSRYPQKYWEEAILKMKAGGINVISTYVFWNMHERKEGKFDWNGRLNLRRFISLVQKHHLKVIVRLSPFDHGEVRNGGLPNWLYGQPYDIRSNDPEYLRQVKQLYKQIAGQLKGYLFKDGGPVIGVQLENEFQHSAARWWLHYPGSPMERTVAPRDRGVTHQGVSISKQKNTHVRYGNNHMNNLKKIAMNAGINVPLYTATAWGNAAIVKKGSIPVTAAYAYPTWGPKKPSPFYLYKDIHKHPDYGPVSYDPDQYPSIPAELGTGIMDTYLRRPEVDLRSIEPMMVRMIGSGSNGIGYYMYHGGSTPVFDGHFYNEQVGGAPKISYDFQAPIGEFGTIRYHYKSLKLLHFFLDSYGRKLALMPTILPKTNEGITPKNIKTLRYAIRSNGHSGFIFMHNFQDHVTTNDLNNIHLKIQTENEEISIPSSGSFDLPENVSAILPFNLDLDGVAIKYATVQPLTILQKNGENYYVFFSNKGMNPEIVLKKSHRITSESKGVVVKTQENMTKVSAKTDLPFSFQMGNKHFLVIPKSMALKAWKTMNGTMIFSDAVILPDENQLEVLSTKKTRQELLFYPKIEDIPKITGADISKKESPNNQFSVFDIQFKKINPPFKVKKITDKRYLIKSTGTMSNLNDVIMNIDYVGDRSMAFIDGKLVADHFYYGKPWSIGMRRFEEQIQDKDMLLMFHFMQKNARYLKDFDESKIPKFGQKSSYLKVQKITFTPEYKAIMVLPE